MSAAERRRVVLLVGGDLMARGRLEGPAAAAGADLVAVPADGLIAALGSAPPDVVVLDLDAGGTAALDDVRSARAEGLLTAPVLAFYSHVDEALGAAAEAAGCRALPRGRFFRAAADLLAGSGD